MADGSRWYKSPPLTYEQRRATSQTKPLPFSHSAKPQIESPRTNNHAGNAAWLSEITRTPK